MQAHQYPLDLLTLPLPTLENFVPGANGPALAALHDAVAGRGPAFVHLWGPAGSGRSHLLAAVRGAAGTAAPRSAAASVGLRLAAPVIAAMTQSAGRCAASTTASGPAAASIRVPESSAFNA